MHLLPHSATSNCNTQHIHTDLTYLNKGQAKQQKTNNRTHTSSQRGVSFIMMLRTVGSPGELPPCERLAPNLRLEDCTAQRLADKQT